MAGQGEVVLMRYVLKEGDDDDAFFDGAFGGNSMVLTFSPFVKVCLFWRTGMIAESRFIIIIFCS